MAQDLDKTVISYPDEEDERASTPSDDDDVNANDSTGRGVKLGGSAILDYLKANPEYDGGGIQDGKGYDLSPRVMDDGGY